MKDKFAAYYNTPEKIQELSEYVHLNHKLIMTKMISEMRRKLDIEPDLSNKDGYLSLICSLQGRLFNELVYSLCGLVQSTKVDIKEIVPPATLYVLNDLLRGFNPLNGNIRTDVKDDLAEFKKYYAEQIDALRTHLEALPK